MTRADTADARAFAKHASKHYGLTPVQARLAVHAMREMVIQELIAGRSVKFRGFGRWKLLTYQNKLPKRFWVGSPKPAIECTCYRIYFKPDPYLMTTIKKAKRKQAI